MIKRIIKNIFYQDNRVEPKDWKDEAHLKFFGLEKIPVITTKDMMNQDSMNMKWIEYQEWKERRDAYEKFTGAKWKR